MFGNPIVGGTTLVRPAIQSPNFVTGVSGWSINIDGSAEFNNVVIRGTLNVTGPSTLGGTLTMTGGACILTAPAPNQRITICSNPQNQINFFSGDAAESAAGIIAISVASGTSQLALQSSKMGTASVGTLLLTSDNNTGKSVWQLLTGSVSLTGTAELSPTTLHSTYGDNAFDGTMHIATSPSGLTVGSFGAGDAECITTSGANSGVSIRARAGGNRWVVYNQDGTNILFWSNGDLARIDNSGRVVACNTQGDGSSFIGSWPANVTLTMYGATNNSNRNSNSYTVLCSGADHDVYFGVGNTDGNGAFNWRLANNGATFMSAGVNNRTINSQQSIDMGLPALGGGNTVNIQAGGSSQLGFVSSTVRHKQNVRTLKETPEKDSGVDNPIFKLRPVRFNWVQDEYHPHKGWLHKGIANAEEINAKHPNGVVGLIAEEVHQHCPDAVLHRSAKAPEPWDNDKHGLPYNDETGNPVTHTPGWDEAIMGVDHDRLLAYLVDAVQHLKERIDAGDNTGRTHASG